VILVNWPLKFLTEPYLVWLSNPSGNQSRSRAGALLGAIPLPSPERANSYYPPLWYGYSKSSDVKKLLVCSRTEPAKARCTIALHCGCGNFCRGTSLCDQGGDFQLNNRKQCCKKMGVTTRYISRSAHVSSGSSPPDSCASVPARLRME